MFSLQLRRLVSRLLHEQTRLGPLVKDFSFRINGSGTCSRTRDTFATLLHEKQGNGGSEKLSGSFKGQRPVDRGAGPPTQILVVRLNMTANIKKWKSGADGGPERERSCFWWGCGEPLPSRKLTDTLRDPTIRPQVFAPKERKLTSALEPVGECL